MRFAIVMSVVGQNGRSGSCSQFCHGITSSDYFPKQGSDSRRPFTCSCFTCQVLSNNGDSLKLNSKAAGARWRRQMVSSYISAFGLPFYHKLEHAVRDSFWGFYSTTHYFHYILPGQEGRESDWMERIGAGSPQILLSTQREVSFPEPGASSPGSNIGVSSSTSLEEAEPATRSRSLQARTDQPMLTTPSEAFETLNYKPKTMMDWCSEAHARGCEIGDKLPPDKCDLLEKCLQSRSIRVMGDKATVRETMKKAGAPTVPGSEDLIQTPEEAERLAHEIGFPVVIKATAGGGGRGMRLANEPEEFVKLLQDVKDGKVDTAFIPKHEE